LCALTTTGVLNQAVQFVLACGSTGFGAGRNTFGQIRRTSTAVHSFSKGTNIAYSATSQKQLPREVRATGKGGAGGLIDRLDPYG
jgi:hypothetical protein